MERIMIVGGPGAGKSTLAGELARCLAYPFLELDELFWGPNWTPVDRQLFRQRVETAISVPQWIAGGNYSSARDLLWRRADTLIWLDYPLWLTIQRLLQRSIRRLINGEELWGGNRETWRALFFSRDSLLLFALKTHFSRRRNFEQALAQPEHAHLTVMRFRTPAATDHWLTTVEGI
jgi:adenylate kinase family enzyme